MRKSGAILGSAFAVVALGLLAGRCAPSAPKGMKKAAGAVSDLAVAAQKTYIAPGDLDEYYLFSSGGHSGQVYVYGVPSMRHLSTIPVFTPYPATGYGFDDDSKAMLGGLTWGDVHHPALSETGGDYDGRWLFANEMNGRVARIDLRDFKTKQIFGPVPNVSGNHASAFVTPNTEYSMMASRFSIPIPKGSVAPIDKYATDYKGVVAAIKIDPKSGQMSLGWEIVMPPFDYDLGDAGKGVSDGWMFWTSYNSERATGKLEVTSAQRDRDYIAAIDWRAAEKAAAEGKGDLIGVERAHVRPRLTPVRRANELQVSEIHGVAGRTERQQGRPGEGRRSSRCPAATQPDRRTRPRYAAGSHQRPRSIAWRTGSPVSSARAPPRGLTSRH